MPTTILRSVLNRRVGLAAGVVALLALTAATASANGGTVRVSNASAGPYVVSVFTSPSPIRVGTVDVSVLVQRPGSTDVVQDVGVRVNAEPVGHEGNSSSYEATHEQATNKLYYAANVALPSEGRWRIEAIIVGTQGDGNVSFEVEATKEGLLDRPAVLVGLIAVPIVLVLGWILLRGRGTPDQSPEGDRHD